MLRDLGSKVLDTESLLELLKDQPQLTFLSLAGKGLSDAEVLAEVLKPLTQLRSLDLSGNELVDAESLAEGLKPLTQLRSLDLSGNELTDAASLAEGLKPLTQLRSLDLSGNELADAEALAEGLKPLTQLTELVLSENKLVDAEALAEGLRPLTGLTELALGGNGLHNAKALALGLKPLTRLTELVLGGNGLHHAAALAKGLKPLTLLESLDLSDNELGDAEALAEGLRPLTKLRKLNLSSNELRDAVSLAKGFESLSQLEELNLSHNRLRNTVALADALKPLSRLTFLDLRGNDGLRLPVEVISQVARPSQIISAIEEMVAGKTVPILEMKVVLVGNGRVGKSQLANRLLDRSFEAASASTPHFVVHPLRVSGVKPFGRKGAKPQTIAAHLYDFGGQPHLWGAHRFFLASRHNLYVVVIDGTREGSEQLEYWLEYIRHYAPGASTIGEAGQPGHRTSRVPVLAVFTHSDLDKPTHSRRAFTTPSEERIREMSQRYHHVVDLRVVREYSSLTDQGLGDVQRDLCELAGGMDYIFNTQYPRGLSAVKEYLRGRTLEISGKKLPPFSRSTLCEDLFSLFKLAATIKYEPDRSTCELWLQMLRNLGVIHWVGDLGPQRDVHSGRTIAKTVYEPQWVQKLVYAVIAYGVNGRVESGVADEEVLRAIIREADPDTKEDHHREILDLMRTCELVFRSDHTSKHLVLDWIPSARGRGSVAVQPLCELYFDRFLPESLLVRCAGHWYEDLKELSKDLSRDLVCVSDIANPAIRVAVEADVTRRRITLRSTSGNIAGVRSIADSLARDIMRVARKEGLDAVPVDEWHDPQSCSILHLSDLHFGSTDDAILWASQLAQDLSSGLNQKSLDFIVISGDVANRAAETEYAAAEQFLVKLRREFKVSKDHIVLVPGNHDIDWAASKAAYGVCDHYSDEHAYARRFALFSRFFERVTGSPYPLGPSAQAVVHYYPSQNLLMLGLNSAWQIDHHHELRSGIEPQAIAAALDRIRHMGLPADCTKIAVWHHSLNGPDAARITDLGFMERLVQAGFVLGLHGHIHHAVADQYRHGQMVGQQRFNIVGAGTFGAPAEKWVPGWPLQYNLLRLGKQRLVVETRCRREMNGAWRPDAIWESSPGQDPAPRYLIEWT